MPPVRPSGRAPGTLARSAPAFTLQPGEPDVLLGHGLDPCPPVQRAIQEPAPLILLPGPSLWQPGLLERRGG